MTKSRPEELDEAKIKEKSKERKKAQNRDENGKRDLDRGPMIGSRSMRRYEQQQKTYNQLRN